MLKKEYALFISHANKDKPSYVNDLYKTMLKLGINIFFDADSISWGDNWKQRILNGTANAEFAIIVISENFFGREWTEKELHEFLLRQNDSGQKIILPLLYNVSTEQMSKHYPSLDDIQYIKANDYSINDVTILFAKELIKRLNENINTGTVELERNKEIKNNDNIDMMLGKYYEIGWFLGRIMLEFPMDEGKEEFQTRIYMLFDLVNHHKLLNDDDFIQLNQMSEAMLQNGLRGFLENYGKDGLMYYRELLGQFQLNLVRKLQKRENAALHLGVTLGNLILKMQIDFTENADMSMSEWLINRDTDINSLFELALQYSKMFDEYVSNILYRLIKSYNPNESVNSFSERAIEDFSTMLSVIQLL